MNELASHQVLIRIFNWSLLQVCSHLPASDTLNCQHIDVFPQVCSVLSPDVRMHGFLVPGIMKHVNPLVMHLWLLGLALQHPVHA